MAMIAGDADCTTGLAKEIYDARVAAAATIGIAADRAPIKADCYAIANAVITYIKTNGVLVVSTGIVTSCPAGAGTTTSQGTGTIT